MSSSVLTTPSLHHHIHYDKKNKLKSLISLNGIIPPSKTNNLQLELVEPILFLRGIPQESVGCFLRGSFQLLDAGTHVYDFELHIPGDLPETIKADRGRVTYKITARAIRPGLQLNFNVSRNVTIIRTIFDERNAEGIFYTSTWRKMLCYEINVSKKAYLLGESMQVYLKFSPRVQNIRVFGVHLKIIEESTYKSNGQKVTELQSFDVHQFRTDDPDIPIDFDEDGNTYYHISPKIPRCNGPIHYSCKSSGIIISHKLKFTFTVMAPIAGCSRSKKNKFEVEIPITILSCICTDDLPTYNEGEFLTQYNNFGNSQQDQFFMDSPPNYEKSIGIISETT
ncbi:cyclin binding protein [Gigaspora margarita]|uniref:Cyclin binding protein n=1 Tax=Gigaspora margarita TaxID=4874 RepID=A0A8H4A6Y6_GIGMA|nr:cyclin binding protein [Gigaspora margarita]